MKRVFFAIALLMGVAMTTTASAKESLKLTLDEAIEMSLSDNPTIKIAELEIERYDYVRKTTMGSLLPQLSVDGTYNRTLKNQSLARGVDLGGDQYNTITATANLSLALYAPAVYRTLKMNATEAAAAVESARSSKIDLVAAVKDSYYGVLLAERSLEVLLKSSATAKQTVDETQTKFDNGLASEYDLLTAQVQYSNLQPSIMSTRTSITIAKDLLKMYLSLPSDVELELTGSLDNMSSMAIAESKELSQSLSGNSSLRSLALTQEVLEHQLRINNASRMPTLGAFGQIYLTGNDMETSALFGGTTSSERFFWQTPSAVGLSLSIPIFTGFTTTSRSRQLENQISQMELQRLYTEDSLNVSLSTAMNDIYTACEMLYAQQLTVNQATKAYEISSTRYDSGTGTILELNTAQLAKTQAELDYSQAIYDLLTAKSEYDRLIGVEQ